MFDMFLTELKDRKCADLVKSLKSIMLGGEATNRSLIEKANALRDAFNPLIANLYGITEDTVHTTYYNCPHDKKNIKIFNWKTVI